MKPTETQLNIALEWARRFGHTETGWAAKILAAELQTRPAAILMDFGTVDRVEDIMKVRPGQMVKVELRFGVDTIKLAGAAVTECPRGKADVELVTAADGEQSLVVTSVEKTRKLDPEYIDSDAINDIIRNMGAPDDVWDTDAAAEYLERVAQLSVEEAFVKYLNWNGIIGYGPAIIRTLDSLRQAEEEA